MSMLGPTNVLFAYAAGARFSNGTFERVGSGYHWDRVGNLKLEDRTDVPRLHWIDLDGDGIAEASCLLVEPAAENHFVPGEPTLADYEEADGASDAPGKYGFLRGTALRRRGSLAFRTGTPLKGTFTYSVHVQREDAAPVKPSDLVIGVDGWRVTGLRVGHLNRALYRVWSSLSASGEGRFEVKASRPLHVYGHQLEQGSAPTTYLRTQDAPTTRAAERFHFRAPQLAYPRATWTNYVRWIHRMHGDGGQPEPVFWQLGEVGMRGLCLRYSNGGIELHYHSGIKADSARVETVPAYHDQMEAAVLWGGDGNATLIVARNGEVVGMAQFTQGHLPPVEWGGDHPDRWWLCDPRAAYQPALGWRNALAVRGNLGGGATAILRQLRTTRTAIGTVA